MTSHFYPARRLRDFTAMENYGQAGDYMGPRPLITQEGEMQQVLFLLPLHVGKDMYDRPTRGSGLHGVTSPPWTFVEHPDGTLEIQGSIASGRHDPEGEYWHGYLRPGNQWEQI